MSAPVPGEWGVGPTTPAPSVSAMNGTTNGTGHLPVSEASLQWAIGTLSVGSGIAATSGGEGVTQGQETGVEVTAVDVVDVTETVDETIDVEDVAEPDWSFIDRLANPDEPLRTARALEVVWRRGRIMDGELTLRHWRDSWLEWTGTHWVETDENWLRSELYRRLEHARFSRVVRNEVVTRSWAPNRPKVTNVLDALAAATNLHQRVEMPSWLDGREVEDDVSLIAMESGLFNPVSRVETPHTPAYFTPYALPFSFQVDAVCPRWEAFLESVWPEDQESKDLLQEWFGYVLSGRTDLQKMMFLFGAKRSGKGVVSRVLTRLVGRQNVAAPTLNGLATNFGLSSLIGKALGVVGDARSSNKTDIQLIIERLLMITGEDSIDVDRKNRAIWTGKLPTRLMMSSNELPWFRDASGAISSRLLVLSFTRSFLGEEDLTLEDALETELPGIFNWALDGLDRVRTTRAFTVPTASEATTRKIEEFASPFTVFLRESVLSGEGLMMVKRDLVEAWAQDQGLTVDRPLETMVGRLLASAMPEVGEGRQMVNGTRQRVYYGIALVPGTATWITHLMQSGGGGEGTVTELPKPAM